MVYKPTYNWGAPSCADDSLFLDLIMFKNTPSWSFMILHDQMWSAIVKYRKGRPLICGWLSEYIFNQDPMICVPGQISYLQRWCIDLQDRGWRQQETQEHGSSTMVPPCWPSESIWKWSSCSDEWCCAFPKLWVKCFSSKIFLSFSDMNTNREPAPGFPMGNPMGNPPETAHQGAGSLHQILPGLRKQLHLLRRGAGEDWKFMGILPWELWEMLSWDFVCWIIMWLNILT